MSYINFTKFSLLLEIPQTHKQKYIILEEVEIQLK